MVEKYYGWIGAGGYDGVVMVKNYSEAYIMTRVHKEFHRNDEYVKAAFDPGSEFEEISKEEAEKIMEKIKGMKE